MRLNIVNNNDNSNVESATKCRAANVFWKENWFKLHYSCQLYSGKKTGLNDITAVNYILERKLV
jgi:hypothetical protein